MSKKEERISADQYFLKIASVVAERSTCLRHHIGAIAVKDRRILATGYNGAPTGQKDCTELGCLRNKLQIPSGERHEICRAIHAEQNVIIQAAVHGISIAGSTIYCTHSPCLICAKMIVNAKIARFVTYATYNPAGYNGFLGMNAFGDLLAEAGISVDVLERPSPKITYLD